MILLGDAAVLLKDFNDGCIDLTLTSPPYDNIRNYHGNSEFNFHSIARDLFRITKAGGILVWIIGDQTKDGDESGSSFKQALYFKEIGFKLHDTMIYAKTGFTMPHPNRYHPVFEFMFIFSKGTINTFNPINDRPNLTAGNRFMRHAREDGDSLVYKKQRFSIPRFGKRFNIWTYDAGGGLSTKDEIAFNHPAIFPEKLAEDHIKSWSNEGDLILDPFAGSGTTLKAAHLLRRKWIGIEINPEYVTLSKKRLIPYIQQQRMEKFIY